MEYFTYKQLAQMIINNEMTEETALYLSGQVGQHENSSLDKRMEAIAFYLVRLNK